MEIREYQSADCREMAELFYGTVHEINRRDYTQEQLDARATGKVDFERWDLSFRGHDSFVAAEDNGITAKPCVCGSR